MYAQAGIARAGATRAGYVSGAVFISIPGYGHVGYGRTAAGVGTRIGSLSITDALDEAPNTCRFRMIGAVLNIGDPVVITLGSKNSYTRQFAGYALTVDQGYLGDVGQRQDHVYSDVAAVDYTWNLAFVKVTAQYRNQSATTIAVDLVSRFAGANGFTTKAVASNLPVLDVMTFTDEDLPDALTRLVRRIGGYWYVDYWRDVHVFLTETRNGEPETLTPAHKSLADVRHTLERSQVLTRVYVEGRGTSLLSHVDVADTMIPLETVEMFEAVSDVFLKASFQGSDGGAIHLSFTGVVPSAGGSLVGVAVQPPGAPGLTPTTGGSVQAGTHSYAYSFATATGETLPSPTSAITIGALATPPTVAPTIEVLSTPGSLTAGTHEWAYTFTSAGGGETTPSPASASTSSAVLPVTPTGGIAGINDFAGGPFPPHTLFDYAVTYLGSAGGETTAGFRAWSMVTGGTSSHWMQVFIGHGDGDPFDPIYTCPLGIVGIKVYRSRAGGGQRYFIGNAIVQTDASGRMTGRFDDTVPDSSLSIPIPTSNTAVNHASYARVWIPTGGTGVAGRKLYRTAANTAAPLKFVKAIANNTDTYVDDGTTTDASLGASPPTSNTAGAEINAVGVAPIALGPPGTTARKIYRTAAAASQLKLLATLNDNTTTGYLDLLSDASLGANPPATDTSGLAVVGGQVGAGATSIPIANVTPFPTTGGWAVIGNGEQVIRFTGRTAAALTGIPGSGIGSITAAIVYNSTITVAPMLTGIPTSGTRSISRALTRGDEMYLVVQCDDAARQTALAADVAGNGIREEWISDRRLSIPEARARGLATLKVRPLDAATLSYRCRDIKTAAGKVVTVNLPAPTNLNGQFRIQTVTIDNFRPYQNQYPTYTVQASTTLFTFEDWLRRMRTTE